MELNDDVVFSLIQSDNPFPVDFDDAIEWWDAKTKNGESVRKSDLKEKLTSNFDKNIDYIDDNDSKGFAENSAKPIGGRPRGVIRLSIETFKMMGMMIAGERGNQIRRYFIRCEAALKQILEAEQASHKERVIRAVVQDEHHSWTKRFEDEFFDQAYRIKGWDRPGKGHPGCMGQFIKENVYDLFPDGVSERLQQVNPKNERGNRSRKHHQHLTQQIGLNLLDYQKGITIAVMRLSPDNNSGRFKRNMVQACGQPLQIELPFMDDAEAS